jgi:ComF family protein
MTNSTIKNLFSVMESLWELVFPNLCYCCVRHQPITGGILCAHCEMELPLCEFSNLYSNDITSRMTGRVPLVWAASSVYFKTGSITQSLLHEFKYRNKREIGIEFGKRLGTEIMSKIQVDHKPDLIIPVPLHPKKLYIRGFNQSDCIGMGLAKTFNIPVRTDILLRNRFTETQTRKSKLERIQNVDLAFQVKDPTSLTGRHVLLVDDVFTSGATLEACALAFLNVAEVQVSIATLALADEW